MKRKTVLGVHAPPPRPTLVFSVVLILAGCVAVTVLGLLIDPLFRWGLGLR